MPSDWAFVSVDLELTNQCDSGCIMCPRDAITRPKGLMTERVFNIVSKKLISEGSLITLSGMGDPLLHPKVFDWVRAIRQAGSEIGIVVNPASLGSDNICKLVEARPNSISVSFPSIKKSAFEKLCPNVSFDVALQRTLKLAGLARGNVGLRVLGVITELNSGEHEEFVRFWKGLKINAGMNVCHGRGGNLKAPEVYRPKLDNLTFGECGLFRFHTFITLEGNVLACCHDLTGATQIGNLVADDVSIIAGLKRKIWNNDMPFLLCRQCDGPLRQCLPVRGRPPSNRKERGRFFRTLNYYSAKNH